MEIKNLDVEIQKAASAEYDARFVMSATSPDRVRDTIDPKAYAPNLGKKLIALWQHDSDQPFGFWENLKVEGGKLIGDLKVSSTNLGQMIKQLIADGVPLGASIGFRGKGEVNKDGGMHFKEVQLLECSVVSVPCHPLAMQIAKKFNIQLPVESVQELDQKPAASGDINGAIRRAKLAILAVNRSQRK
jgi:HK97 family phage prohead protease